MEGKNLAPRNLTIQDNNTPPELRRALDHVGLFSRVAANLGLSVAHVLRVAKGERRSRRVTEAVVREVRRIERRSSRERAA